jgi:NAD dependent epimerase/dehydratase family enzyme
VLVNASAIGIYGDRGDEELTEKSAPGSGFLADLCREWEAATETAERAGVRVVHLRTGIVLAKQGAPSKNSFLFSSWASEAHWGQGASG